MTGLYRCPERPLLFPEVIGNSESPVNMRLPAPASDHPGTLHYGRHALQWRYTWPTYLN